MINYKIICHKLLNIQHLRTFTSDVTISIQVSLNRNSYGISFIANLKPDNFSWRSAPDSVWPLEKFKLNFGLPSRNSQMCPRETRENFSRSQCPLFRFDRETL